jgi:hypothetical protein
VPIDNFLIFGIGFQQFLPHIIQLSLCIYSHFLDNNIISSTLLNWYEIKDTPWTLQIHNLKWWLVSGVVLNTIVCKLCLCKCTIPLLWLGATEDLNQVTKYPIQQLCFPICIYGCAILLNFDDELHILRNVYKKWLYKSRCLDQKWWYSAPSSSKWTQMVLTDQLLKCSCLGKIFEG